jgi:hypothetical protein
MSITATGQWFHNALKQALSGNMNLPSDSVKMALLSAVPSLETAVHWSDVSGNDISPTGGGVVLTSVTVTETTANSWGDSWAATTAYAVGQVVRPATGNGFLYRCVVAGTSAGSAPTFPTVFGETVIETGGLEWVNCGSSITVLTAGAATFTAASGTISPLCAVIYDAQTGVAATEPLVALGTFASTPTATTVTVSPDANLGFASQTLP